jgi:hypothetical protein
MLERTHSQQSAKEKELASQLDERERELNDYKTLVEGELYAREQQLAD